MSGLVLLIDDDATSRELLKSLLEREFFEVLEAEDGAKALGVTRSEQPDVVMVDINMPGADGYEICQQLKSDPVTAHIPVIMVSGDEQGVESRIESLKAGADDFLPKPIKPIQLFARVRSLTRLKRTADEWRMRQQMIDEIEPMPNPTMDDPAKWKLARFLVLDVSDAVFDMISKLYDGDLHHLDRQDSQETNVRQLLNNYYDCVLIEFAANDVQKLRLCTMIRSSEKLRHVPILIVALDEDEDLMLQALDLGVNDVLTLPTNEDEMLMRTRTQILRRRYQKGLEDNYKKSLELALTDQLTGLYNRRYAMNHLETMLGSGGNRHDRDIGILMMDIDHFKAINDTYGHQAGDHVLREVSARIQKALRNFDLVARIGGEEFLCVLPDARAEVAQMAAERVRDAIASEPFLIPTEGMQTLDVTISVGVACGKVQSAVPEVLMKQADDALYKAKNSGRNKVEMAEA